MLIGSESPSTGTKFFSLLVHQLLRRFRMAKAACAAPRTPLPLICQKITQSGTLFKPSNFCAIVKKSFLTPFPRLPRLVAGERDDYPLFRRPLPRRLFPLTRHFFVLRFFRPSPLPIVCPAISVMNDSILSERPFALCMVPIAPVEVIGGNESSDEGPSLRPLGLHNLLILALPFNRIYLKFFFC